MPLDNRGPFPREVVRDLLGITRVLYRAELKMPPPRADRRRRERLEEIGKHFRLALELAAKCDQGTMGRRAAWDWAEKATEALGEFVQESVSDPLRLLDAVEATAAKLMRAR